MEAFALQTLITFGPLVADRIFRAVFGDPEVPQDQKDALAAVLRSIDAKIAVGEGLNAEWEKELPTRPDDGHGAGWVGLPQTPDDPRGDS